MTLLGTLTHTRSRGSHADVTGARTSAELRKAQAGEYKEAALQFLTSHWQAAALASLSRKVCIELKQPLQCAGACRRDAKHA